MSKFLVVFLGGGLGSALRYWVGAQATQAFGAFTPASGWPYGTLIVNVVGCAVMGLMFRLLPAAGTEGPIDLRLLLMTGLLGGFTTFSAFALDTAHLWMRQDVQGVFSYVFGSVLCSLLGLAFGLWIGKVIAA